MPSFRIGNYGHALSTLVQPPEHIRRLGELLRYTRTYVARLQCGGLVSTRHTFSNSGYGRFARLRVNGLPPTLHKKRETGTRQDLTTQARHGAGLSHMGID